MRARNTSGNHVSKSFQFMHQYNIKALSCVALQIYFLQIYKNMYVNIYKYSLQKIIIYMCIFDLYLYIYKIKSVELTQEEDLMIYC